jgi:hypothetical protein
MIEVHFLHPRNSTTLTADLDPRCTGEEAIRELLNDDGTGAFLAPTFTGEQYQLAIIRTRRIIAPAMTFEQAGVVDGDVIEIRLAGLGAAFRATYSAVP